MSSDLASKTVVGAKPEGSAASGFSKHLGPWLSRVLFAIAACGMLVGFFMPWVTLGRVGALTGFSLMVTSGDLVGILSRSNRVMLAAVPVLGIALLAAAVASHRFTIWLGAFTGISLLGFGLVTLIGLFFSSTGLGMWIVVASAVLAFGVGVLNIGVRRSARS